jgi:alpha-glucosidase
MDGWARDMTTGEKINQQPWVDGEPYTSINRKYLQLRERLMPYLYTLAKQASDTGVGGVRPLWLEYPDDANTLGAQAKYEYLAGDDFLVAPVYKDSDTRDGIYLPKGTWTDYWTGKQYKGPTTVDGYHAPIDTLPLFVKSGAIVPMWPKGTTSWKNRDKGQLGYDVYASEPGHSAYTLYEDDGVTRKFKEGASATQHVSVDNGKRGSVINVGASKGSYAGKVSERAYSFTVHGGGAPERVTVNGRPLPGSSWSHDEKTHVTTVRTAALPTGKAFTVRLST